MTQANLSVVPWAQDGFVVDPDTDASHPSGTGGPGKVVKGWLSETEPQQWENWVINTLQLKMLDRVQKGLHQIDSTVTYKANSIVWDADGKIYHAKGSNFNKPTTDAATWEEAISYSQSAWLAITNQMATDLVNHTPTNVIKHGETIAQAGGKTQLSIDNQVAALRIPMDQHIAAHYPHHETAIQIGTIPSTGGNMDGQINYAAGFSLSSFDEVTVSAQAEMAGVGAPNGAAFGVGYANYLQGGRIIELVSMGSLERIDNSCAQLFKAPPPDILFPLVSDLRSLLSEHTLTLLRPNTLAYTDKGGNAQTAAINVAPFEALGLKTDANTQLVVSWPWRGTIEIATIVYHVDGVRYISRQQYNPSTFPLQWLVSPGHCLRDVRIWFQFLSDKQIANLP